MIAEQKLFCSSFCNPIIAHDRTLYNMYFVFRMIFFVLFGWNLILPIDIESENDI